jgi:YVTN family beta-propeller protein
MAPDGKRLYVTGLADGAGLSVIHTASARVEATVSVASSVRPFDAVVSPDQATVWVTDYTGSLLLVDATTNRVRKTLPVPGQNPRGIAMGLDGNTVLVANQDSDNLLVLEAAPGRILQTVPAGQRPRDIALKDVADPLVSELISGTADFLLFADLFGKTR